MCNILLFSNLRQVNVQRCEQSFHPLKDWSQTDWACAVAGEVGELCNLIKKRRRGEDVSLLAVEKEIADVIIYIDLLAAFFDIDLNKAIINKFNEVSDRIGSDIKL